VHELHSLSQLSTALQKRSKKGINHLPQVRMVCCNYVSLVVVVDVVTVACCRFWLDTYMVSLGGGTGELASSRRPAAAAARAAALELRKRQLFNYARWKAAVAKEEEEMQLLLTHLCV
jgi:hypothetical protein